MNHEQPEPEHNGRAPSWVPVADVAAFAVAAIGMVIGFGWWFDQTKPRRPLPVFSTIQHDLEATERSGRTVRLSSLRGKVTVMAHIYTVCPHGCLAVLGEMLKLQKEFGARSDFHLVSVSVVPEHDTAAFLHSFTEGMGLRPQDPWWFLTGDRERLWGFMTEELGLNKPEPIPEPERLNPLDLYAHDLRIVLVDRAGRVRGYYDVLHPQPDIASLMREKLQSDTRLLLDDPQS